MRAESRAQLAQNDSAEKWLIREEDLQNDQLGEWKQKDRLGKGMVSLSDIN